MWSYLSDPTLGDFERLFFALYGRALQGDDAIRSLLDDDVAHWLDTNVALTAPLGIPADVARTHARLGLAVTARVVARPARHGGPAARVPSRRSRHATVAGGGSVRPGRARATAPRRGHGAPGSR